MVLSVSAVITELASVSASSSAPVSRMATCGVRKRSCVAERAAGSSPRSDMAKGRREVVSTPAFRLPMIETTAPATMSEAPAAPRKTPLASATGRSDVARPGSVPTHTA